MTVCNLESQGCGRASKDKLNQCAKRQGFDECSFEKATWKHYPDSPFGDIDICPHGVTRDCGDTKPHCIYCDYPDDAVMYTKACKGCSNKGSRGWHIVEDGKTRCLKCGWIEEISNDAVTGVHR